jgi:large-conductance mechanosensitive channel
MAALNIGLFTNAVVESCIVAFVLFLVVKVFNSLRRKKQWHPPLHHQHQQRTKFT